MLPKLHSLIRHLCGCDSVSKLLKYFLKCKGMSGHASICDQWVFVRVNVIDS